VCTPHFILKICAQAAKKKYIARLLINTEEGDLGDENDYNTKYTAEKFTIG